KDSNKVIEGLHFTFIELPKFTPHSIADKRMMVLWLRFLTEINSNTKDIPSDLLNDPEIGKAVEELEISGFSDAELRAYDKFWDSVSVERTLIDDSYQKGKEKGKQEGLAEGMEKGRAEGKHEANTETAQRLLAMGLSAEQVAKATQLPLEIIKNLSNT
ncbi:Rpn family recombination-promoting nuclease/putative transposase, partial [Prevotella copri]|uniref:Rpn family recombination-promoting nuclease/putative transposase n=1 Tax=Segatella copri TaxID=165179 RepID=UPI001F226141